MTKRHPFIVTWITFLRPTCLVDGSCADRRTTDPQAGWTSLIRCETSVVTPSPAIVTPYNASAISIERFWWVMTISWLESRSSSNSVSNRPSPFYIMDEVEAALDDANLGRLLTLFEELRDSSQLIVITHQKRSM